MLFRAPHTEDANPLTEHLQWIHFNEPQSDAPILQENVLDAHHDPTSPRRTDLNTPTHSGGSGINPIPISSPIFLNPLLQRNNVTSVHTPSPAGQQSGSYRTCNGNEAWAVAEGLILISEGFNAPGYAPVLVGGISFEVCLPRLQHQSTEGSNMGRRLSGEHSRRELAASNGL